MEVQNTRFGTLKVNEDEMIFLNGGLMGFPMSNRFIMFPYSDESSFFWLQSVDESEIAFIVINPFDFFNDLIFEVADDDAASISWNEVKMWRSSHWLPYPTEHLRICEPTWPVRLS